MIGLLQSFTVTLKLHRLRLPTPSVALQRTVVVPTAKLVPEAGEQLTVGVEQLSDADTL